MQMVISIPAGGNWQDIPEEIPSKRLEQIRASGGRTTYYGRLRWDRPSYTVTTYFNRPGNGCYIHPDDKYSNNPQHRLLSFREAARLQSFPDSFRFFGPKTSMYKQIGNAVPPLLAFAFAKQFKITKALDLFCGCGGLSYGFELAGVDVVAGVDIEKHFIETWRHNHSGTPILGDITKDEVKEKIYECSKDVDIIIGGPPCQGFSTAGWRSEDDARNSLWKHYLEIVKTVQPKYFLIENVVGLLTTSQKGSSVLDLMRKEFSDIDYEFEFQKMHAEEFGVPQLRRRVFIIGTHKNVTDKISFPKPFVKSPVTVSETIKTLPVLTANDGNDELVLENHSPNSVFEEWLIGRLDIKNLLVSLNNRKAT